MPCIVGRSEVIELAIPSRGFTKMCGNKRDRRIVGHRTYPLQDSSGSRLFILVSNQVSMDQSNVFIA